VLYLKYGGTKKPLISAAFKILSFGTYKLMPAFVVILSIPGSLAPLAM
jgi:hypothetical protein